MRDHSSIAKAAAPIVDVVRAIRSDQLDAPTPCAEFDVRGLVNHLLYWGPTLEGSARKESVPPPEAVDVFDDDWARRLAAQVDRLVDAWGDPAAWQGTTVIGGDYELPADLVAGMVVGELVVHGWDLARATGQRPTWDEDVLAFVHEEVAKSAQQGRDMGIYGPEVVVPATASALDRTLGLTGRDPAWTV
jgi:uncharacterized protein (TIGR03086 family)